MTQAEDQVKIYTLVNVSNGARVKCTDRFLLMWLAKGFEVESYKMGHISEVMELPASMNPDSAGEFDGAH